MADDTYGFQAELAVPIGQARQAALELLIRLERIERQGNCRHFRILHSVERVADENGRRARFGQDLRPQRQQLVHLPRDGEEFFRSVARRQTQARSQVVIEE